MISRCTNGMAPLVDLGHRTDSEIAASPSLPRGVAGGHDIDLGQWLLRAAGLYWADGAVAGRGQAQ
jgi:hypothetical protein